MKTKKPNEKLDLICQCSRCYAAEAGGGRAARSSARSRDGDLRTFLDMPQATAEHFVRVIAQHGVAKVVEQSSQSLGTLTLLAYHSGSVLLGNARPRTCVLVRPKGYAAAWLESVDHARDALKATKHRTAEAPESDAQLDLFGSASE